MAALCLPSDHVFCDCRLSAIVQARIVRGLSANSKFSPNLNPAAVAEANLRIARYSFLNQSLIGGTAVPLKTYAGATGPHPLAVTLTSSVPVKGGAPVDCRVSSTCRWQ